MILPRHIARKVALLPVTPIELQTNQSNTSL